ncbi:MAG: protein kinase, partial [Bacteroidota bacterium]
MEFKKVDYYLQVGELKTVQGWILHLSVVISKIPDLLESVVPFLTEGNIPFKIVMDKQTARNLLTGYLGAPQVGKLVSIYPHNDKAAVDIAKHLIDISVSFVGPNIPTDAHLGSIVYTRYGSFNAIMKKDEYGKNSKYIYNSSGILIKDSYSIPFHLPTGIKWPFNDIKRFIPLTKAKIINHFYKPTLVLKEDSRGNVYKGIYAKGIFNTADGVIKKGNKYMCSEESGRDVSDRLKWQYELHKHLSPHVPLPKSIDFFSVDGDTYFVMEFIKGVSLNDLLSKIIFNSKCWKQLDEKESQGLLEYLIQIVDIIGQFHTKGFIHRDIQPANFLITSKKEIYLIDIELAYCVESRNPTPPFELGTPGFMSPEQKQVRIPTVKEDIYGLGALMICFFTGLSPLKFDVKQFENLSTKLNYFINNSSIANLVTSCVHPNPELRPSLIDIASNIKKYSTNLTHERNKNTLTAPSPKRSNKELNKIIIAALNGLSISPIVQLENIWYSRMVKSENQGTPQQKEYTRYSGIHEGISGVLYLLARAKRMGFNITSCLKNYNK